MGGDSNDLEIVRDVHLATGEVRYQVRITVDDIDVVPRSPWYTPALQEHLLLAGKQGPAAVQSALQLRPALAVWVLQVLPPALRDAVLDAAWTPDPPGGDPGGDPGAP